MNQHIPRVLLADDDDISRKVIALLLMNAGLDVTEARNGREAMEFADSDFDLILLDVMMPEKSGHDCLEYFHRVMPQTPVVMVSGVHTIDDVISAVRQGAYWYLQKPVEPKELLAIVERALDHRRLWIEHAALQQSVQSEAGLKEYLGVSPVIQKVITQAETVANLQSNLLITGESGTGKSLLARLIHANSPRRSKPFVVVNCASLPRDLLESELFGHVKGAFTGAINGRPGQIEVAHGGTIFLDEIGDLPLDLQPKLLTFIQDRVVRRIGSNEARTVDVRIIAATLKDLPQLSQQGAFREDLLFRLRVIELKMPRLAEHLEDLPILIQSILSKIGKRFDRPVPRLDRSALEALQSYAWPGNVRELENVLEYASAFCRDQLITKEDLRLDYPQVKAEPVRVNVAATPELQSGKSLSELEKAAIEQTLRLVEGNRAAAAKILEISERSIYNKIKLYGLEA